MQLAYAKSFHSDASWDPLPLLSGLNICPAPVPCQIESKYFRHGHVLIRNSYQLHPGYLENVGKQIVYPGLARIFFVGGLQCRLSTIDNSLDRDST